VDVVATPANASLLANHPAVRDVIVYDKRGMQRGIGGLRQTAEQIRFRVVDGLPTERGVQVAYMAQGSARSAALVRLARVQRIVGFDKSAGRWLYTERVAFQASLHHTARLLSLAGLSDSVAQVPRPSLYPGANDKQQVDVLLAAAGVRGAQPVVVLAPGSVWATKRWPSYHELAVRIRQQLPDACIVITGSALDAPHAAEIVNALARTRFERAGDTHGASDFGATFVDATGKLSLLATAELMSRAAFVVTNDSAPLHLASAMNTPTVAIFGPTVPAFGFGPLADRRVVVQHETLECRPCDTHGPNACPLGHWRCMRQIEPDRVAREALSLVDIRLSSAHD